LGVALGGSDRVRALAEFEKALALKPDMVAARYGRGVLIYQEGKPAAALPDLEYAAQHQPDNAKIQDRLGQTLLSLDRPADACPVLRKAVELAPNDSMAVFHYARALAEAGRADEAKAAMDRFRRLGSDARYRKPGGLVRFLSLDPEEQYEDYRARLERLMRADPMDAQDRLSYLELMLDNGENAKAEVVARELEALHTRSDILLEAGHHLLEAEQYKLALELFEKAADAGNYSGTALDLAIARFHVDGAAAGLQELERMPAAQRGGDYYLARAQMLSAAGRNDEALQAVQQALAAAPKRPALYHQATLFLIKAGRLREAVELLDRGARLLPDHPELPLEKATTLELATKTDDAEAALKDIERRWPEWPNAWVASGIILDSHKQYEEAEKSLETAIALGARSPEAYFYLAESTLHAAPDRIDAAQKAITRAEELAPDDPWVRALAGRIAFEKGDYHTAVAELREAIKLRPNFVQAHYNLARAYGAMGRKQDSEAEAQQVAEIRQKFPHADEDATEVMQTLFQVRLPRDW